MNASKHCFYDVSLAIRAQARCSIILMGHRVTESLLVHYLCGQATVRDRGIWSQHELALAEIVSTTFTVSFKFGILAVIDAKMFYNCRFKCFNLNPKYF